MAFMLTMVLLAQSAPAAPTAPRSPIGYWQTVSDVTGQPQSVVKIYEDNGRLFARVEPFGRPRGLGEGWPFLN